MKRKIQKRQSRRTQKKKNKGLSVSGKIFSIFLLLVVVGAIAFFVLHRKSTAEAERHMAPRLQSTQHALALANGPDEVILRC